MAVGSPLHSLPVVVAAVSPMALSYPNSPGMIFSTSGGPGSTLIPGVSIPGASQQQQPTSPGLPALAACKAAAAGTTGLEAFGQTTSTQQQQALGSRAASCQPTHTIDTSISTGPCQVTMRSITAMGAYQHMSAEELRWADYEAGFSFGSVAAPTLPAPAAAQSRFDGGASRADNAGRAPFPASVHDETSNSAGTGGGFSFGVQTAAAAAAASGSASSAGTGAGFGFGALPAAAHSSASSAGTGAGSSFGALPAATATHGSAGSAGFSFGMPSAGLSGRGAAAALVPPAPGAAQPSRTLRQHRRSAFNNQG
ncbi:hypothetical protein OEZ85_013878 [Tetradesmus obliquus]|uniref:Uncharacterized protein n=1 Tax=Tetradesmus obliquus TaxID=3088 RepID=A0ABY8U674_TETOB|nr:hypothetical protein OEZ85_013878 [Tetradesmus obliquus]